MILPRGNQGASRIRGARIHRRAVCQLYWRLPMNRPTFCPNLSRNNLPEQPDSERQDHRVVQVAQHGNEVGNQVDRTERVRDETAGQPLGGPRGARVFRRQPERLNLTFQTLNYRSSIRGVHLIDQRNPFCRDPTDLAAYDPPAARPRRRGSS